MTLVRRLRRAVTPAACLVPLFLVSAAADAECFAMYDARNALVYQSNASPIDLSRPISGQMAASFPGRFLVISTTTFCGDDSQTANSSSRYGDFGGTSAAPVRGSTMSSDDSAPRARAPIARRR